MNNEDVISWINNTILENGDLRRDDLQDILDFTLLWNLFELTCCDKKVNKICLDNISENIDFEENEIESFFVYFYDRYKNEPHRLISLFSRDNDSMKPDIQNIINREYDNIIKKEKLQFLLYVVYRLRNNMFHGEKNMSYIKFQKENFMYANHFLQIMIKKCRRR